MPEEVALDRHNMVRGKAFIVRVLRTRRHRPHDVVTGVQMTYSHIGTHLGLEMFPTP